MTQRSLWIDGARPSSSTAGVSAGASASEWISGIVTDVLDGGWVEVGMPPDAPTVTATGPSDGTLTQVGALVRVLLDSMGRILQISSPTTLDTSEGAHEVIATGASGEHILSALSDAAEALAGLSKAAQDAAAAQSAANSAAQSATDALKAAENAGAPAVFAQTAPANPADGQTWYTLNSDGQVIGVNEWVAASSSWLPRPILAGEVIVPGSVGSTLIADGAVTTPKVNTDDLWATFVKSKGVTTDMLVAGNATISSDLIADKIYGKTLTGGELSLSDTASGVVTNVASTTVGWNPGNTVNGLLLLNPSGGVMNPQDYGGKSVTFHAAWSGDIGSANYSSTNGVFKAVLSTDIKGGLFDSSLTYGLSLYGKYASGNMFSLRAPLVSSSDGGVVVECSIPDNSHITSVAFAPRVYWADGYRSGSGLLYIKSATYTYDSTLLSGLRIHRDATGLAKIDIATSNGLVTLTSQGVEYSESGTEVGTVPWRSFVAPPIAVAFNRNSQPAAKSWSILNISSAPPNLSGGVTYANKAFTVPVAGIYRVTGWAQWSSDTAGGRHLVFYVNGSSSGHWASDNPSGGTFPLELNELFQLNAGDTVSLYAEHTSTNNITITGCGLSLQYLTTN